MIAADRESASTEYRVPLEARDKDRGILSETLLAKMPTKVKFDLEDRVLGYQSGALSTIYKIKFFSLF